MIYVLGSLNMDMVAVVPYMPARGETLSATKYYQNSGGKGANQAAAIAKLGGRVSMIGKIGNDAHGAEMVRNLESFGVLTESVTVTDEASGVALILVESGDNRIVLNPGANYAWADGDVERGLEDAKNGDILIMQLEVPMDIIERAAAFARDKGMKVILNPAPAFPLSDELYRLLDVISPNETETKILTGIDPVSEDDIRRAMRFFTDKGVRSVIITLGSRGAAVCENGKIDMIPAKKVKVVDTTSAGDTFTGACAVQLEQGAALSVAAEFATVASSITITREGAASSIPTLAEVEEAAKKC